MTAESVAVALQYFKAKRYDAAEEILNAIPTESESYPKAIALFAKCAYANRNFQVAEEAARRAIEVGGETNDILWTLASVLRIRRKFADAAGSYARALELAPPQADRRPYYQMMANCLLFSQEHGRAETVLREALQHFPEARFLVPLAEVRLKQGDPKEALQLANAALALDGNNLRARELLSVLQRPAASMSVRVKQFFSTLLSPTGTTARRQKWIPFPSRLPDFENARRVIKSSLLRGYPTGDRFIHGTTRFLTFGSCFASSLATALRSKGMEAFTEFVGENVNNTYANLAFLNWVENGVQDETGAQMQAAYGDGVRERYLKAAQECDAFVFTLGLAPAFFDKATGKFFFMSLSSPGSVTAAPANYEMRMTTVAENVANLRQIIATIRRLSRKPVTTVLTVSPVPLAATREMDSAVIADCLSKSTLRLACEEVRASDTSGRLHYWPSFEIVRWLGPYLGVYHPPVYGREDEKTRHLSNWIVRLIIDLFLETYSSEQQPVSDEMAAVAAELNLGGSAGQPGSLVESQVD